MTSQDRQFEEAYIVAGEVKAARAGQVDERSGAGREGTVPQVDEIAATGIALFRLREDFFRLKIEKSHAHGAVTHDAFKVTNPAAAAESLLGVESHCDVAAFPYALDV